MPEVQRLWLSVRWVSMMPVACTGANMVVGPTQTKPRRYSSAASAGDSGEQVDIGEPLRFGCAGRPKRLDQLDESAIAAEFEGCSGMDDRGSDLPRRSREHGSPRPHRSLRSAR